MTSPQALTFSMLLKRFRMAAGLTQEELAEKAGLSASAVGTLERGISRAPRRDTVALLADALGLAPSERSLFERAARDRLADMQGSGPAAQMPRGQEADTPALVGRGAELARIDRFLTGEGPSVLLVMGEPGIGKTCLLQATVERASLLGWSVVQGSCNRRSALEPYAPFPAALLRYLRARSIAQQRVDVHGCGWLARLLPELTEAGVAPAPAWNLPPDQERRLMHAAVAQLLVNIARPAGTLLALDDLHWASADGLDLLAELVRGATDPARLRAVVSYRDSDVGAQDTLSTVAADLARQGLASPLKLGPLNRTDAAALLNAVLGHEQPTTGAVYEQLLRRAGGVPFYLVSFGQELRAHQTADAVSHASMPSPPWRVAASIRQRVALLTEDARQIVEIVALATEASPGVPHTVLTAVARGVGCDQTELVNAVEAACGAQLLVEVDHTTYACAHELIGEVVRADLTNIRRHLLHRLLAEALEGLPETARAQLSAALAWHFGEAGAPERALPYALLVGDRAAAVYAHREAEQYYRTAVALAREVGDAAHEAEAQVKLGTLYDNQGRFDDAIAVLELAARGYRTLGDRERLALASHRLARAYHRAGRVAEGVERLQALVIFLTSAAGSDTLEHTPDLAGQRAARALDALPHGAASHLGISLANYLLTLNRPEQALVAIERAATRARLDGDTQIEAHASYMLGNVLTHLGRLDEAEQSWRGASVQARAAGNLDILAIALSNLGLAQVARCEFTQARRLHEQAQEVGTQLGDPYLVAWSRGDLAELAFLGGDWSQARTELEAVLNVVSMHPPAASRAVGLTYGAGVPLALLGRLHLAAGRTEEGQTALGQALQLSEGTTSAGIRPWAQQALAEYDLLAGASLLVRQRLEPFFVAIGSSRSQVSALPAMLAWALAEQDELDRACQVIEAAAASARAGGLRLVLLETLPVVARVALRAGRLVEAVQAAEEALALARLLPVPYAEAKALVARGLAHVADGETDAARACNASALAILHRLGERLYAGPVERALIETGA